MAQPINSTTDVEKYFSNELKNIFDKLWDEVLEEVGLHSITTDVFMYYTLSEQNCLLYKAINGFLNSYDIKQIQEEYSIRQPIIFSGINNITRSFSIDFRSILSKANEIRAQLRHKLLTSDHILCALIKEGKGELFTGKGLSFERMLKLSRKMHDIADSLSEMPEDESMPKNMPGTVKFEFVNGAPEGGFDQIFSMMGMGGTKNTTKSGNEIPYCTNFNKEKYEPVIGRDKEIWNLIKILGRKKRSNAVLVGDAGVGKTSVVRGLVNLINSKECPSFLADKIVYRFNPFEMIGGTQLRGMFEERLNNLVTALKKHSNYIFFIDDFHNLLGDKQQSEYDFIGGLSGVLKDGNIKIIATSSQEGYKNGFEKTELSKLFQRIDVDAPSTEESISIIRGIKENYEDFHRVKYADGCVEKSVELSKRYITEKSLPSSAIDILDESGAKKKIEFLQPEYITEKVRRIKELEKEKEKYLKEDNIDKVKDIDTDISGTYIMISEYQEELDKKEFLGEVTVDDIYGAVSEHTNIPITRLSSTGKESIREIENTLKKHIVGQDEAMEEISKVIKRNKAGLFVGSKPIGSFMYIGNTGCGKTLTAKILAKEIFGDEKYLVRFDMSEYSDKTAVNKLIGAGSGYVGYDKGGLLTEAVKRHKHCVLLIDEIEKADEEVYNLFLQVLDEGFLTDNTGYKVDFKNTIVIFTSNIGTKEAALSKSIGFNVNLNESSRNIIEKSLKKKFPPEFINRLDKIVYFNQLTDENIKNIIGLELGKLDKRITGAGYNLSYDTDSVIDFLFDKIKDEREYGARPVIRIIQNEIENKLADAIMNGDDKSFKGIVENDEINIL